MKKYGPLIVPVTAENFDELYALSLRCIDGEPPHNTKTFNDWCEANGFTGHQRDVVGGVTFLQWLQHSLLLFLKTKPN